MDHVTKNQNVDLWILKRQMFLLYFVKLNGRSSIRSYTFLHIYEELSPLESITALRLVHNL